MYVAILATWHYYMKTRHSKQVLVGLSVFSDSVLHFLQIKKKFYLFYQNYLVALKIWKVFVLQFGLEYVRFDIHKLFWKKVVQRLV